MSKEKIIISIFYERNGLHFSDRSKWTATYPNGDVFDYGKKAYLIEQCKKEGFKYQILSQKREVVNQNI